jgi:hypothetical protein
MFNNSVSTNAQDNKEFKIVNKADSLDELGVIKTQIDALDGSKIILTLDKPASPLAQYEITVLDLKDENGLNIES